ncbi:hypothetical protein [Paenibacillus macerans]|uniref:hypothetical protein n=1 Tax=Paenibacillus macerans TaxID=44252 RepID=UPI003D3218B8
MDSDGLVMSLSYSLGGEDLETTEVTYSLNLWNRTNKAKNIVSIEPVLDKSVLSLIVDSQIQNNVNEVLLPLTNKDFQGQFKVDTRGLDKEQIANLINLKEFKVRSEQLIGGDSY